MKDAPHPSVDLDLRAQWESAANGAMTPPSHGVAPFNVKSVRQLIAENPDLRPPVIEGLLRVGETLNCIAAPKTGKSWLVVYLALCVATGRRVLDTFTTVAGPVLIIDNELHSETIADRIPQVAGAMGVRMDEINDAVEVVPLRGSLQDLLALEQRFYTITPGKYKLIILDAFYRFLPKGTDENDNGAMAILYNTIDRIAARLGCAFVLVHHTAKGSQAAKAITDIGAGAGAQSRATDSHLVLLQHEEDGVVVLGADVRSWPKLVSFCLRWQFPIWVRDDSFDPALVRRSGRGKARDEAEKKPPPKTWEPSAFAREFVSSEPRRKVEIIDAAVRAGAKKVHAVEVLGVAESQGLILRSAGRANLPATFTLPPSSADPPCVCVRVSPPTPPRDRKSDTGAGKKRPTHTDPEATP